MDYKNKIYERYIALQTSNISGAQTREGFAAEFPVWDSYFRRLLPDKTAAILDLACGNGAFVHWLHTAGYQNVQGVDISKEQVAQAQSLHIGNISQADFRDFLKGKKNNFDVVFALDIMEHLTKPEVIEALGMIHDSLKGGGFLIIKTPNGESPFSGRYLFGDFTHETIFTERSLKELFAFSGFSSHLFMETGPVIHGFASSVRWFAWQIIRLLLNLYLRIETGQGARVLTQNIIAVAKK